MIEIMLAYIFRKLNNPGAEPEIDIDPRVFQKLIADDGVEDDYFGFSLAISADDSTIVIGAPFDDDKGFNSGSVYIFTKQANGNYLQTLKLIASDGAVVDYFGFSVDITADSSTIVIGAHWDDDKATDSGSVYVFTKQADGSYLETQKLVALDGTFGDEFGKCVTISADGATVVVGASKDDDKGNNSGSVYVFTKQANGNYLQTQKLLATDRAAEDYFGHTVAVSGDGSTVVIGAYGNDGKGPGAGAVYIFTKQANGNYLQTQKLIATDGTTNDFFGNSVDISADGTTVVVGAYYDDNTKGANAGSVYIFIKQANGSYLETQKLLASDQEAYDYFGSSVAVSADGSTVVIGAYINVGNNNSGSVYVFTKQANGNYLQSLKLVATDGTVTDEFGWSVAVSNTSVAVGARWDAEKGAVYVY